jgi:hypothetical protein
MALGGVIGGILGSAVGGPLGASIGTGLGQTVQGAIQKKKSQAALPSSVDPREQSFLNILRRRQQAIATGTASMDKMNAAKSSLKTLMKNSFSAGVNQGAYNAMLNQAMGNITAEAANETANNNNLLFQQTKNIADASRDIALLKSNKLSADAAENEKAGFQNLATGLMPKGDFKYNPETDSYQQDQSGSKIQDILNPGKKKKKSTEEVKVDESGNPI